MKSIKVGTIALSLLLVCSLVMSGCTQDSEPAVFTLVVETAGGMPLSDVGIRVFSDEECTALVWAAETDSEGKTSFTAEKGKTYTALLKDAPKGYKLSESYSITEENSVITLETVLLSEDSLADTNFELGSVFCDFTVTDTKGTTHKLSELLKAKKAVVLNFWFINCGPCKLEFPYLQKAYTEYSDSLEVIAINPVDGTDSTISAFAEDNSLTFPMAVGSSEWETAMKLTAYPTTVIIDRYGTVGFVHGGYITETEEFTKLFEFFTSDGYTQTTVENIDDIN